MSEPSEEAKAWLARNFPLSPEADEGDRQLAGSRMFAYDAGRASMSAERDALLARIERAKAKTARRWPYDKPQCSCPMRGGDDWRCLKASGSTEGIVCRCHCHKDRVGSAEHTAFDGGWESAMAAVLRALGEEGVGGQRS